MARSNFENLRVYQVSERLADCIWTIVSEWHHFPRDTVGKQLVRAADSIGANIAEGAGRGSFQDNRRFIRIARASLYETKHWLRRAFNRKLISAENVAAIKPLVDELAPKLNAYLKSIGDSKPPRKPTQRRVPPTDNGQLTTDN
ncbi:MAG: four helix bundle protein [Pirellulales bacterium]|nr:four helix bundle protein [Pirellulales bacterium]